jgi:polysaccharide chain length determinant protein (PEP-CTERM system associated)
MEQDDKNPQDIVAIAKRRKWFIIIPMLTIFFLSVAIAFLIPPKYRSTSTILIEEQEIPREYVSTNVTTFADQRLQTINQQIMGTSRLLEIIERFNLYGELKKSKTVEEIVARMRKDIKFNTISADVVDPRSGRTGQATIAFAVSYDGKNPAVVQKVANELASLYLNENLKTREKQSLGTTRFMEEETKSVQAELAKVDAKMASYKQQNINTLPELTQLNIQMSDSIDRDIRQMSEQLRTLREKESYLQSELSTIPTDAANQDKTRLNELRMKLVDLRSRFSDKHPDVIKTKADIAEITKQLRGADRDTPDSKPDNPSYTNIASQLAATRTEIESTKRMQTDLFQKRDNMHKRIGASPRVEEGYKNLLMERNNLQLKFDDLSKKFMEARVAHGLEKEQMGERFTLIDAARLPEKPISPNIPAIILIGFVLGVGGGCAAAALKDHSDGSVYSSDDLFRATGLQVLGVIPEIETPKGRTRHRFRLRMALACSITLFIVAVVLFHFFIMDLDVLWAKLGRRFS